MSKRGGELVAADEPAIDAESLLDAIVVEDGESDGRLANSTGTDESKWGEVFCQADELFDQFVPSKETPALNAGIRHWIYRRSRLLTWLVSM